MKERAAPGSRSRSRVQLATKANGPGALLLESIGDRHLAFSEAHQAIYELNEAAAHVWRSLDGGMSVVDITRELVEAGADPDQAERAVATSFERLRTLLAEAAPAPPRTAPPLIEPLTRVTILIAGVAVQLHLSQALVADVEAVFGALIGESRKTDLLLCARVVENTVGVYSPGKPDWSCERPEFIPLLKAQIIDAVLARARYEVALHAAALVRGEEAVLLVGAPGAGKTTLAIALAKAGLKVIADDVVLLDEAGLVTGVSLPFTAKASSWALLSQHWCGIANRPSHRRPDGQTLCYIPPDSLADPRPRRIGSVILLDRRNDARACVEEIDPACALTAFIADGATRDERLGASGFTALIHGLRDARCYRLTYSELTEAAAAVCGVRS